MRSKAAAVISALLYTQGLLGFAALAAVLLKHPDPAHTRDAVSTLSVKDSTVGHSMGGQIALAYALDHQPELTGLVLTAPALANAVCRGRWSGC